MRKRHSIIIGQRRGIILLPDENRYVLLNPIERTLYRLFLSHPDGIPSDDLLAYWQELCRIYEQESCFDDKLLRDGALESLCSESKNVFYSTVSRVKKKFVTALGARKAAPYIIRRSADGNYRTSARYLKGTV
ncbi:MAG: hypothetical protein IJU68_01000 [Bacteroidales bacterium]|nr:hypothetical protein [Bacteroidales bacterium]